jgi:MFS family permease
LIEGVSDGAAGAAKLAGGALADDPSRRRTIALGGYTTTAVLVSLTSLATSAWQVGVLRSAYGRAYGFERAMDNLGAIAGPLLAILLVGLVGVRNAIALSIIPGLLATVAIFYAVRRVPKAGRGKREPVRLKIRPVLRGRLGRMMIGVTAFEFGNVAATLLILRAADLLRPEHGRQAATQLAIGLYVLYNTAATFSSVPAGRVSDARGTTRVLAFGVGLFAIAYLGFAAGGTDVLALAPWFIAAGIGIGCVETSEHAAVAALADPAIRSSAFGLLATVQSLGNFVASALAGLLWTAVSPRAAFLYIAVCMAASLAAIFATRAGATS